MPKEDKFSRKDWRPPSGLGSSGRSHRAVADLEVLRRVRLFSRVPAPALATLARQLVLRRFQAGQVIFHQGDDGASFYLIESGRVKVVLISEEGEELLVAILDRCDFFGELALLDSQPRSATAVSVMDTRTYTLGRDGFLSFLKASPEAALAVCAALAERLRSADERLGEIAFLDLTQRLARRVLHLAQTHGQRSPQGIALDLPLTH